MYKPIGALAILQRNLLIYGLGGVIIPLIGIKAIDLFIVGQFGLERGSHIAQDPVRYGVRKIYYAAGDELRLYALYTHKNGRRTPDANIGIVTGEISGIVAIDEDGPDGQAAFTAKVGEITMNNELLLERCHRLEANLPLPRRRPSE